MLGDSLTLVSAMFGLRIASVDTGHLAIRGASFSLTAIISAWIALGTQSWLTFLRNGSGDGPRHFHFHPNGRWFYSIQEEGSTIVLFDYDAASGKLTSRQTISTLPPGFAGSNFCSEILVSADGKFVYAGNRLHDSIGIFAVGSNGELTVVGEEWTRGNYPRSFSFSPTGEFLYCCNQRADNVAVFKVDRASGALNFTGHYMPVGNPSAIIFLDSAV